MTEYFQKVLNAKSYTMEEHRENGKQQEQTINREVDDDRISREELVEVINELKLDKHQATTKLQQNWSDIWGKTIITEV